MDYNSNTLVPIIYATEYDDVATSFLESYFPDALRKPMAVPIMDIAEDEMGLSVKKECLSEELDILGMTVFADGNVDIYDPDEGVYESKFFKRKTIIIDPYSYQKSNSGCLNNTIAHECVHWYKHRLYFKMQDLVLPRKAKICKCYISQLPTATEEEIIMENQAVGIAPRILMPERPFIEAATDFGVEIGENNIESIQQLANLFDVSKQSVSIRLEECGLL